MPIDAPYTGGFIAGARIYAVDGDYTSADPCGPPQISYPLPGDSQPSGFPIIILDRTQFPPVYTSVPIGEGFNVQPLTNSQAVMVIEQEFMVATSAYVPMPLNTPYYPPWGTGWDGTFLDLEDCFLVEEGPLVDVGGGISRFKRKFCNLPPNRNEYESYNAQFPALDSGGVDSQGNPLSPRFGMNRVVNSRIFYEYFILDDAGLQTNFPLFPQGHRITSAVVATLGTFLLIEDTKFFKDANSINTNNLLDVDQPVSDTGPTVPSFTTYATWANFGGVGTNGIASEIVAEASSFTRWMGNIHVRKTRFVTAL